MISDGDVEENVINMSNQGTRSLGIDLPRGELASAA